MTPKLINSGGWNDVVSLIETDEIQHISFDFWNTIALPNPQFKEKRAQLIRSFFNGQVSNNEIDLAFLKIGKEYNDWQELGNPTVSPLDLLESALKELRPDLIKNSLHLHHSINNIFLEYPPVIEPSFFDLVVLMRNNGKTCSITSNTAFIPGAIIVMFLSNLRLLHHFEFIIFSDEFGFGKPCDKVFNELFNKALQKTSVMSKKSILHVGDSLKADYMGAMKSGLTPFYLRDRRVMNHYRNALHVVNDINSIPFSPVDYSKFKFGSLSIAKKFGSDLFDYFIRYHFERLNNLRRNIIVYSSPYSQIPTSSYYLSLIFYQALKEYIVANGLEAISIELGKIERCQTYTEDYGALTAEERFNLIKNDTYKFITIPTNKDLCIFIDDISITGTHQRVIEGLLDKSCVETEIFFLYYAKLDNFDICPSFENYLNYYFIDNFNKLIDLVISDDFLITTRTTKYILGQTKENLQKLVRVLAENEKFEFWKELVSMSYANRYDEIDLYSHNLLELESGLQKIQLSK